MARVPAHGRLDVAGEGGGALPDVGEERRRAEVAGGRHPGRQRVVGGVEALPDLRRTGPPGRRGRSPGRRRSAPTIDVGRACRSRAAPARPRLSGAAARRRRGTPITVSRTAQASASSTVGSSRTSWKCTSSRRAVSSARSTYRPIQNSDSATRLSIARLLTAAAGRRGGRRSGAVPRTAWAGNAGARGRVRAAGSRRGGEHPGVLRAAALAGVDDQAALPQRDPGQPAGQHLDLLAVVDRERPQVDVPGHQPVVDLGRGGRQQHHLLRDPAPRVGQHLLPVPRPAPRRWRADR